MKENRTALRISLLAVTTALVAVFTMLVRVPTPTGGYINLCDVAITFIAYTFGPITGFIAGGLGTALADALGGYMQYAPISFVVHGLEALLVALIVRKENTTLLTMRATRRASRPCTTKEIGAYCMYPPSASASAVPSPPAIKPVIGPKV